MEVLHDPTDVSRRQAVNNFAGVLKYAAAIGLSGLIVLLPSCAHSRGETEKELIRIQNEWAAARVKPDVPYLENLYAKEFRIQAMNGTVVERDADIAKFATGALKPDYVKDEDMKVSVYGDTAVVTGIENVGGTYKGTFGEMSLRFTNVFVRRDGRWQLVAHQSTLIPKK
jgi:ketosteroid isomerase-like protein